MRRQSESVSCARWETVNRWDTTSFWKERSSASSGALVGAACLGRALPLPPVTEISSGGLPIDRQQGDFLLAIVLTTLAAMLASILPARNAAQVDPVEAIGA